MEVVRAEIEPAYRRHLVLSGELIAPADALARGLVDEILAPAQLLERAVELAAARAAATSYAVVKRQLKGRVSARMWEVVAGRDPLLEPDLSA